MSLCVSSPCNLDLSRLEPVPSARRAPSSLAQKHKIIPKLTATNRGHVSSSESAPEIHTPPADAILIEQTKCLILILAFHLSRSVALFLDVVLAFAPSFSRISIYSGFSARPVVVPRHYDSRFSLSACDSRFCVPNRRCRLVCLGRYVWGVA